MFFLKLIFIPLAANAIDASSGWAMRRAAQESSLLQTVAEGFYHETPPPGAKTCFGAAVHLGNATGLVVKTERLNDGGISVWILTAFHVVDAKRLTAPYRPRFASGPLNRVAEADKFQVFEDPSKDLALIKMTFSQQRAEKYSFELNWLNDAKKPDLVTNCASVDDKTLLYGIGWPDTKERAPSARNIKIPKDGLIMKRWSFGYLAHPDSEMRAIMKEADSGIGEWKGDRYRAKVHLATISANSTFYTVVDVDALPGNSGGPICTDDDQLFGVVSAIATGVAGYYLGLTFVTPCEDVRFFLNQHLPKTEAVLRPVSEPATTR